MLAASNKPYLYNLVKLSFIFITVIVFIVCLFRFIIFLKYLLLFYKNKKTKKVIKIHYTHIKNRQKHNMCSN